MPGYIGQIKQDFIVKMFILKQGCDVVRKILIDESKVFAAN
jgi:hypothetical protein